MTLLKIQVAIAIYVRQHNVWLFFNDKHHIKYGLTVSCFGREHKQPFAISSWHY